MRKFAILVLTCLTFYACKTEEVYFNVTEPAPVTIPAYVKKIGIINSSLLSDSNGVRKAIDDVLSVKGPNLDKDCGNECIRGLKDALVQSNTFQDIVFLDSVNIKTSFPGAFPSPLSWDKIDEICRLNNVDALFALELFHTDTRVNLAPSSIGSGLQTIAANASINTTVNTGWRIYDPQDKLILDEYLLKDGLTFEGGGPLDAASALMNHKQAVMGVGYHIGQSYASRILPYTIRVCREFYVKGSDNFLIARRMANAGDWNNAAALWSKDTTNTKIKVRARAYYNLAIINEINGKVVDAIGWAKKAYETGGKRLALIYLNNLQDRKAQDDLLKSQTHGQ
ncbi:MAG TPA: DUF6340 family protein [Bacteroidia bacterium]|nr:DUF6340 family protein [Bacteroidia bacterium]